LFYSNLAAGKLNLDLQKIVVKLGGEWKNEYQNHDRLLAMIYRSHAYSLRYMAKALHCVQTRLAERKKCFNELDFEHKHNLATLATPTLASVLTPGVRAINLSDLQRKTRIECLRAALAAERFRLQKTVGPRNSRTSPTPAF
jgi:hypothetical protein